MSVNQVQNELDRDDGDRLDRFETEWLGGAIPNVTRYLAEPPDDDTEFLRDLIEIDLEYRWRQFRSTSDPSARDIHGFPLFPLVDDYAALLPPPLRDRILCPEFLAEEYRVRCRWGDQPTRSLYQDRFPEDVEALDLALNDIDEYLTREHLSPRSRDSSEPLMDDATIIISQKHERLQPTQQSAALGSESVGRYRLDVCVGRGAFGVVWKAYDPVLKRTVAIKFPRPDRQFSKSSLQAFEQEAQRLASLDRIPGIVTVFDCGDADGHPYLVSDFIDGENLDRVMKRGAMPFARAASLVANVAAALHKAHQRGIVHRDIKPSNILLDSEGHTFLADFGLAVTGHEMLAEDRSVVGTYTYMSPEQARGDSHRVDGRADIFALGVILYRLLTGKLPFRSRQPHEVLDQILNHEPQSPRSIDDTIPPELERICLKCLRKDISERYATAQDLANDLQRCPTTDAKPRSLRRPLILASVLLILLSVASFQWIGGSTRQSQDDPAATATPGNNAPIAAGADADAAADQAHPQTVVVLTQPPGAQVVAYPLGDRYGFLDGRRRVAAADVSPATLELAPGSYLVVAALPDGRFHEVYRTVPTNEHALPKKSYAHYRWQTRVDGSVEWPVIEIPPLDVADGMARFEGSERFQLGVAGDSFVPVHHRVVPGFLLDPHETSWGEFVARNDGHAPASLAQYDGNLPPEDMPIAGIWYDDAVMYAEKAGKRLPTEAEYEFAATAGGTRRFPWGDQAELLTEWTFGPVKTPAFDRVGENPPVFGLYSNVAEWTSSWGSPYPPRLDYEPAPPGRKEGHFIVRGGPFSVIQGQPAPAQFSTGPRARISLSEMALHPGLGFRCARSLRPRIDAQDLERVVSD